MIKAKLESVELYFHHPSFLVKSVIEVIQYINIFISPGVLFKRI
jgi:hypothetical protein